ncbi:MAG: hypothetical protein NC131_03630 [Roseburia sp.]|nr:hypothetical protein [Roseburia sp.]
MSENFRKIKKKYTTVAVIAGAILGVCLGIALTCTLAVIFKSRAVNFHWALYIPIALALSAGAGYPFFLLLRPDDKRIAKKLDKEFALNQKVQTMVEYAGVAGELPELQRKQTDEALDEVARKRVNLKGLLKFAFVPVIAAAMLFAGIFVPAKKSGVTDRPYEITDEHETALKNLISDVENSSLETGLKDSAVGVLDELLDMLVSAEHISTMKTAVISSVHFIDALMGGANSYLKIDEVLKADETLKPFSTAIVNGVVDYKNGASLTTMKAVNDREADSDERITQVIKSWETKYLADYAPKAEGADEGTPLPVAEAALKLSPFASALASALTDARLQQFAPAEEEGQAARASANGEALFARLSELSVRLTRYVGDADKDTYNAVSYYAAIGGAFDSFIERSAVTLSIQSYNCMMDDYLRNALSRIFDINRAEFGSNASVAPTPTEDVLGSDRDAADGGYGKGEHLYGSNDTIYDANSNEIKKYGDPVDPDDPAYTFYTKYYNNVIEKIQDGACSDEVAAYIKQYFAYLNNGMGED